MSILQGRVFDASGALLANASVGVRDDSTNFAVSVRTDPEGHYSIVAIPAGTYGVEATAPGFRLEMIEGLTIEIGRTLLRDFHLAVGDRKESVVVRAELPLLDRATGTVGHMVAARTIQEIPLNGRHFVDLGLLVPGSTAPSQMGFSSTPLRGTGALAFNSAGREETVGYLVNGVTTNNLTFGSIGFPPPISCWPPRRIAKAVAAAGAERRGVKGLRRAASEHAHARQIIVRRPTPTADIAVPAFERLDTAEDRMDEGQ